MRYVLYFRRCKRDRLERLPYEFEFACDAVQFAEGYQKGLYDCGKTFFRVYVYQCSCDGKNKELWYDCKECV